MQNYIKIMRSVNHPRIISLHEVYETDDAIFLVMDLIDGQPLESILYRPAYRKSHILVKMMRDLLEVLDYLASQGIVHRGLNLQNILLEKTGSIKLIDLGSATNTNFPDKRTERFGTPGFISPEIFLCDKISSVSWSNKCDVFSAGCIFFYL